MTQVVSSPSGMLRHAAAIAWKDLRVELRSKEIATTTVFFAVMVVLISTFAYVEKEEVVSLSPLVVVQRVFGDPAAAILWIALTFSGMLGLGRAFEREREHDTLRALLLAPIDRAAIFLGKATGVTASVLLVAAVVVPLVGLFYQAPIGRGVGILILLIVLATIGFAVVGSTFAAMLLRARMREVLLPVLVYPILVPALIAGAKGTTGLWSGLDEVAWFWTKFLLVYDAIFIAVALWAFESLVVE